MIFRRRRSKIPDLTEVQITVIKKLIMQGARKDFILSMARVLPASFDKFFPKINKKTRTCSKCEIELKHNYYYCKNCLKTKTGEPGDAGFYMDDTVSISELPVLTQG